MKTKTLKTLGALVMMTALLGLLTACSTATPAAQNAPAATAAETAATAAEAAATAAVAAEATATPEATGLKVFDAAELAKYDGQNGNPAYVAVDGKVYDVTNVPQWRGGSHAGGTVKAGLDQTEALKRSPHGAKNLEGLPIVGLYQ